MQWLVFILNDAHACYILSTSWDVWPSDVFYPRKSHSSLIRGGASVLSQKCSHWIPLFCKIWSGFSFLGYHASITQRPPAPPVEGNVMKTVGCPLGGLLWCLLQRTRPLARRLMILIRIIITVFAVALQSQASCRCRVINKQPNCC